MTEIPFGVELETTPGDAPLQYELPVAGRVRLTVRAGQRRTGGHAIRVTNVRREGAKLTVRCEISAPEGPPAQPDPGSGAAAEESPGEDRTLRELFWGED